MRRSSSRPRCAPKASIGDDHRRRCSEARASPTPGGSIVTSVDAVARSNGRGPHLRATTSPRGSVRRAVSSLLRTFAAPSGRPRGRGDARGLRHRRGAEFVDRLRDGDPTLAEERSYDDYSYAFSGSGDTGCDRDRRRLRWSSAPRARSRTPSTPRTASRWPRTSNFPSGSTHSATRRWRPCSPSRAPRSSRRRAPRTSRRLTPIRIRPRVLAGPTSPRPVAISSTDPRRSPHRRRSTIARSAATP